jgi:hypothetical protein
VVNLGVRDVAGGALWSVERDEVFERPLDGPPNISQRSSTPAVCPSGTLARGDGEPLEAPVILGGASTGTLLGRGLLLNITSSASNSVTPPSRLFSVASGTESAKNSRSSAESDTDSDAARRERSDSARPDLENRLKNLDTPDDPGPGAGGSTG